VLAKKPINFLEEHFDENKIKVFFRKFYERYDKSTLTIHSAIRDRCTEHYRSLFFGNVLMRVMFLWWVELQEDEVH
jgi:hypothetical protein